MECRHEAFALAVDQRRAFAAQRLGRKRRRIAADHDRGRVELHEFGVGDHGAGARGDRKARSVGLGRIGGDGIEMADAAGRQHDRARGDHHGSRREIAGLAQLKAGDGAVLGEQCFGDKAFDQADRRRAAHGLAQRRDDRSTRAVAADVDDAPRRMRSFPPHGKPAFEIAIERHAIGEQIVNPRARLARDAERDRFIDDAAADRNGIRRMRFGTVAFGDSGRDAALRPCG